MIDSALSLIISFALGYLLGSINTSVLVSKTLYRKDIRDFGSKNAGMSNTLRVFGIKAAAIVTVCDILKTVAAVFLCRELFGAFGLIAAGAGTVLGHAFPVYYGFKGGKCVLCSLIILAAIDWRIALMALGIWVLVFLFTRIMSASSILACLAVPILSWHIFHPSTEYIIFISVLCAFVIILHHSNIVRLLNGTEQKMQVGKSKIK